MQNLPHIQAINCCLNKLLRNPASEEEKAFSQTKENRRNY